MRRRLFPPARGAAFLIGCAFAAGAGCNKSEFPTTYPVKGKVLVGDKPIPQGGTVEFECVAQPEFRGFSRVAPDGTFGPVAVYKSNGKETQGLIAGEYRVRVIPNRDDEARGPEPFPKRFQDFVESGLTTTVEARDNDITVTVDPSKPAPAKKDNK